MYWMKFDWVPVPIPVRPSLFSSPELLKHYIPERRHGDLGKIQILVQRVWGEANWISSC